MKSLIDILYFRLISQEDTTMNQRAIRANSTQRWYLVWRLLCEISSKQLLPSYRTFLTT